MALHPRLRLLRAVVLVGWILLLGFLLYCFDASHVSLRHLPRVLKELVLSKGVWGPFIVVGLYFLRATVFGPTTILIVLCGSLYGPLWGTLLAILGENLSAFVSFYVARFLGRPYVAAHERSWVRKYDEILTREGFITVLLMRVLFFPFDVVNLGSGMSGMPFRSFAFGTFFGLLPATITFSVLGGSFARPRNFAVFVVMLCLTLSCVFLLQRSPSVRARLRGKPPESNVL